jgi:CheY-like chemotaxis protein
MSAPLILFVAPDPTVQRVMTVLLQHCGYRVETAAGVDRASAEAARLRPAVVLIDAELRAAGWQLVRELRSAPPTRGVAIIGIHATNEAIDDALAAGCDACLGMPLDTHALLALLGGYAPLG